jgi:hypothetical protein
MDAQAPESLDASHMPASWWQNSSAPHVAPPQGQAISVQAQAPLTQSQVLQSTCFVSPVAQLSLHSTN